MTVGDKEVNDPKQQSGAFPSYFEDLAMPKEHPDFDEEYLDLIKYQLDLIQDLCVHNTDCIPSFIEREIHQAIKSLNIG